MIPSSATVDRINHIITTLRMATDEKQKAVQVSDDLESLGIKGLPRDRAVGWFKFEKIGDAIGGEVVDMFFQPANDGMGAQRVFTLKRANGELWNVGLKWNGHTQSRTDGVQIGDKLGLRFEKEIPAQRKGYSPAKSIGKMPEFVGPRTGENAAKLASPASVPSIDAVEDGDPYEAPSRTTTGVTTAPPSEDDEPF